MLLVVDVGNTNIVLGIYDGQRLVRDWRVRTEHNATEDEFNVLAASLFATGGIDPAQIRHTVISCVVPPMKGILEAFCVKYLGHHPRWVDPKNAGVMPIRLPNPAEVGADRIVNGVAAHDRFKCSLIVIDFGTATTFDAISEKGEYLGGAIAPGILISAEALFQKASKLPRVDIFEAPETVIGTNTIHSIQSGIIYGYAALVEGMIRRMAAEMSPSPLAVATGGLAPLIADVTDGIDEVAADLTLEGLRIIHEKTAG